MRVCLVILTFLGCLLTVAAGSNQSIADSFPSSIGDGITELRTIAGDGTGECESVITGGTLTVGENGGNGTVEVNSGGTLEVQANSNGWRSLYLGYRDASTGTLRVTGNGSLAKFGSGISVGYIGAPGSAIVENGGRIESNRVQVAGAWTNVPTTGEVLVTGNGSSWDNETFTLGLGNGAEAEATISSGATMQTNDYASLGFGTGSYGQATVTGFESRWDIGTDLIVGGRGSADLMIESRSTVTAQDGLVAQYASSTSSLRLEGFNAKLAIENDFLVGGLKLPTELLEGGDGELYIGAQSEARFGGTLRLFNPGAITLDPDGDLWANELASHSGGGTLNSDVGSFFVNKLTGFSTLPTFGFQFSLGHSDGTGELHIPAGETLNVGEVLTIGEDTTSQATLTVEGAVSAQFVSLGLFDEAVGQVIVTGADATLEATDTLSVGLNGSTILDEFTHGDLQVLNGATATAPAVYIGRYGGTGEILVDDATLTATTTLEVGGGNQGTLTVQNNGLVTGHQVIVGAGFQSSGSVLLTTGGEININGTVDVGSGGTGDLTMNTSAKITASRVTVGSESTLDAAGAGTQITAGSLGISDGGTATLTDSAHAELLSASVAGELTLRDASLTIASSEFPGTLIVQGRVNILDGSTVLSLRGEVGMFGPQDGHVEINGSNSQWITTANDRFFVGGLRNGMITSTASGDFQHSGDLFLGVADADTEGQLRVIGNASAHIGGDLFLSGGFIDGQAIDVQSRGVLNVSRSSTLTVDGDIISFEGGSTLLSLSRLEASQIDIATHGGTFDFDRSELVVDAFVGNLSSDGGTLLSRTFGNGLTITGDYTQDETATLQLGIAGTDPGEYDYVDVSGTASLQGTLAVELVNMTGGTTPMPQLGDTFELLTTAGGLAVDLDQLLLPTLGEGLGWQLQDDGQALAIAVVEATIAGDYNGDGTVDAADYTLWRQHRGDSAGTLANDSTGLRVGEVQFVTWRTNFGATAASSSAAAAVPEPTTLLLSLSAMLFLLRRQR